MADEEGAAVLAHKVIDGLPPPAGLAVAVALQHQRPAGGSVNRERVGGGCTYSSSFTFFCERNPFNP